MLNLDLKTVMGTSCIFSYVALGLIILSFLSSLEVLERITTRVISQYLSQCIHLLCILQFVTIVWEFGTAEQIAPLGNSFTLLPRTKGIWCFWANVRFYCIYAAEECIASFVIEADYPLCTSNPFQDFCIFRVFVASTNNINNHSVCVCSIRALIKMVHRIQLRTQPCRAQ